MPSARIQEEGHDKDVEITDPPSPIDLPSPIIKDPFGDGVQSPSFDQPVRESNDIENSPNPSMWTNRTSKVIYKCHFSHNAAEVQMFSPASIVRSCGILSYDPHDLETFKFHCPQAGQSTQQLVTFASYFPIPI